MYQVINIEALSTVADFQTKEAAEAYIASAKDSHLLDYWADEDYDYPWSTCSDCPNLDCSTCTL